MKDKEKETDGERTSILWFNPQMSHSWDCGRTKTKAQESIQVSNVVAGTQLIELSPLPPGASLAESYQQELKLESGIKTS